MIRRLLTYTALVLAIWGYSAPVFAHAADQSYIFLRVFDDRVDGRIEIGMADLNKGLSTNFKTDTTATLADLEPHMDRIHQYVRERVSLAVDGTVPSLPLTGYSLNNLFIQYLALEFSFENLRAPPGEMDIEMALLFDVDPDHRGMVIVEHNWKTGTLEDEANVKLVFSPGSTVQSLDLTDASVWQGFKALVGMGIHHIWIGIDHILFLLALLLPAVVYRRDGAWQPVSNFREALIYVIKVVTIFTVAHTITLSLAALGAISLSSRLIESIIAISIAIAALNIFVPIFERRIWLVVFVFGLFHGFGFASVLGEIGIPSNYMVHSLLGFNVGVEIGQVAIVCGVFPLLYWLRQSPLYAGVVLRVGAVMLIAVSMYWFTERAFMVDLPAGAIVNKMIGVFQ